MMRAAALATAIATLASACSLTGLSFRQDDRLAFLAPEDRSEVTLPVTVRWEVEDFQVGPGAGSFAVFVDRAPQPPGKPLEWLARDDSSCESSPTCPDEQWFADRYVFPTTSNELRLERLPARADDRREFHEVTVVLLDEKGRRVGETAWSIEFQVTRGS